MSRANIADYVRPQSLHEAWELIESNGPSARFVGGGSDLTIATPATVGLLVDLSRVVPATVEIAADEIRIGAMATLTAVAEHPTIHSHVSGVVVEMLSHVGSPLLRNTATLGGHLARGKLSDVIPVLLALDAAVTVYTGEGRAMSLAEYYESAFNKQPHILTEVHLPALPHSRGAFMRLSRTAFDFPIINACARVDFEGDRVAGARIVLGATPMRAQRATRAEASIQTAGLTPDGIAAAVAAARDEIITRGGWTASAEYRTHLVGVLVERCLRRIAGEGTS